MNAQLCIKEPLVPSLVSIHILHPQVWLQGYAGCSLSLAGEITLKSFLHLGIDPQAFFCKQRFVVCLGWLEEDPWVPEKPTQSLICSKDKALHSLRHHPLRLLPGQGATLGPGDPERPTGRSQSLMEQRAKKPVITIF